MKRSGNYEKMSEETIAGMRKAKWLGESKSETPSGGRRLE
jgi:hypothetical protein